MKTVFPSAAYFSSQVSQTRRFYQPNATINAGRQLAVVGGGCEWCAADFLIEREHFSYTALEFIWAGRGRLRLGRRWYDLAPGAVYLFDRGVPHTIRSDAAQPLVKYFFNFSGSVQSRREVVLGTKLCQNRRTYGTSITRVRPHDGGSASGDPI
jgi:hypothetical protein